MKIRSLAVVIVALVMIATITAVQAAGHDCGGTCAKCKQACPPGPELKIWGSLESKPKIAEAYGPDKVEIGVGSFKLLELRGPAAGYTLAEREVAVYNRLVEALSMGPVTPDMVCVGKVRSAPTVYVGPVRVVSAYVADGRRANTTPQALACSWAHRLAEVLPQITKATTSKVSAAQGAVLEIEGRPVYEVAVGGTLLFRLRGADGFPTLQERGIAVEAAIVKMLSDGKYTPTVARPEAVDGDWVVMFGNVRIVTATAEDAAANKSTPELLAKTWAGKLNAQLDKLKGPTGVLE